MTAEEKVKAKWPDAVVLGTPSWFPFTFKIWRRAFSKKPIMLGEGANRQDAWEDAAKRIG